MRLVICERLWLRLIGSSAEHNISRGSGQLCTVVPEFTKKKEQKGFLKTSGNDAMPDRTPLLHPGLTPPPELPTSRRNRPHCQVTASSSPSRRKYSCLGLFA